LRPTTTPPLTKRTTKTQIGRGGCIESGGVSIAVEDTTEKEVKWGIEEVEGEDVGEGEFVNLLGIAHFAEVSALVDPPFCHHAQKSFSIQFTSI